MSETTPATTPLTPPLRLLLALAALSSTLSLPSYPPPPPSASTFDSLLEDEQDVAARERRTRARAAAAEAALRKEGKAWVAALCKVIDIDVHQLPDEIEESRVRASVEEAKDGWTEGERERVAGVLVEAGLAASKAQNEAKAKGTSDGGAAAKSDSSSSTSMFSFGSSDKEKERKKAEEEAAAAQLRYTPLHRTLAHRTLTLLTLSPAHYLPQAEARLGATLFSALKSASDAQTQAVETTRAKHAEGWGGSLGRKLATGAGVIAGGVLLGVTGGLAAPAIAAVLAPLGVGSILTAGAAPVVLGTLFGVGGGGLAGRRVRERWRGVEEFGFTEVGKGTRISKEEAEELRGAKERYKARVRKPRTASGSEVAGAPGPIAAGATGVKAAAAGQEEGKERSTEDQVEASRQSLEERLLALSLSTPSAAPSGTANPDPPSPSDKDKSAAALNLDSPRASLDAGRPSLNAPAEEAEIKDAPHPPSLTATIVVPGLLTVSQTEAVSAWRAICSGKQVWSATLGEVAAQKERLESRSREQQQTQATAVSEKEAGAAGEGKKEPDATASTTEAEAEAQAEAPIELSAATTSKLKQTLSLSDGRDVYLLRFEPALMLKTGREIDHWVTSKLKGKIKAEIIKRTVLNAYFAAVSLPLTVYGVASMSLDNSWMQAQDRANKAGRILGEVLEQRVQGERPVVLIGSSIGALTILKALLYLASRPSPSGGGGGAPPLSTYVESAYLISLPAAPTSAEWAACRSIVSRRLVNAYSGADWVLAGVVRLHEVISRAATLNSGISPAGLAPVEQTGVEDVDVGEVVRGHMEVNAKMGDILRIIDVDA